MKGRDRNPELMWLDDGPCYVGIEGGSYTVVGDRLEVGREPDVLLRTSLVRLGNSTEDGTIVQSPAASWFEIAKHLQRDPGFRFQFTTSPRKFEELVAGAYRQSGWQEVVLTHRSSDKGRDVIATKRGLTTTRMLDQARAYSAHRRVTHDEVRAILGVRSLDKSATGCGIVTTSLFAPTIRSGDEFREVIETILKLRDGQQLLDWLADISGARAQINN